MTTQEVADRLVALNREMDHMTAYAELYVEEPTSVENWGEREEYVGREAIKAKGEQWEAMVEEMHSVEVSEPLVAEKSFAVTFTMDVTYNEKMVGMEGRHRMTEMAIYRVNEEGKIYHEEFLA